MPRLCSNKDCRAELPEGRKTHRCRDCSRAYNAIWSDANREKARAGWNRYSSSHTEERRERGIRYRAENPEKSKQSQDRWRSKNPEWFRERDRRRRALVKGCTVGVVDEKAVVEKAKGLCQLCGILVPPKLREIDHVVPLSKGGPHTQDNLQLLCRDCNRKKGNRLQ